jgi:thiol-disulfide isomerase/thioredoxin
MKYFSLYLVAALCVISSCKTTKPVSMAKVPTASEQEANANHYRTEVKFSDQSTWLLGYFNAHQLSSPPYSEFYQTGFDAYQPGTEAMNRLHDIDKKGLSIKIVMGTWCPDSRREVPRFMKILSQWQFPASDVIFIGVDNQKLSPVGEYDKLGIVRVPTFILYKNNNEAGRIIENPVTSLEQDMVNILAGVKK